MSTIRLVIIAITLVMAQACATSGPTREQKIDQVVRAAQALDMPIMRNEILPVSAKAKARTELEAMAVRFNLGPEWKAGNTYRDRAERELTQDYLAQLNAAIADPRIVRDARTMFASLTDAELDQILTLYRSDAMRKATALADAGLAVLTLGLSAGREPNANTQRRIEELGRIVEREKLTPADARELEKMLAEPGVKAIMEKKQGRCIRRVGHSAIPTHSRRRTARNDKVDCLDHHRIQTGTPRGSPMIPTYKRLVSKASSKARVWLDTAISFAHGHAKRMKEPVDWSPPSPPQASSPSDRHGNLTARTRQQVTPLRAVDNSGSEWTILEIIPVEPIQRYDRTDYVQGRPRYELKDGTPVVQRSDKVFEVSGKTLTIES